MDLDHGADSRALSVITTTRKMIPSSVANSVAAAEAIAKPSPTTHHEYGFIALALKFISARTISPVA
jgi:hypothetical protein